MSSAAAPLRFLGLARIPGLALEKLAGLALTWAIVVHPGAACELLASFPKGTPNQQFVGKCACYSLMDCLRGSKLRTQNGSKLMVASPICKWKL